MPWCFSDGVQSCGRQPASFHLSEFWDKQAAAAIWGRLVGVWEGGSNGTLWWTLSAPHAENRPRTLYGWLFFTSSQEVTLKVTLFDAHVHMCDSLPPIWDVNYSKKGPYHGRPFPHCKTCNKTWPLLEPWLIFAEHVNERNQNYFPRQLMLRLLVQRHNSHLKRE